MFYVNISLCSFNLNIPSVIVKLCYFSNTCDVEEYLAINYIIYSLLVSRKSPSESTCCIYLNCTIWSTTYDHISESHLRISTESKYRILYLLVVFKESYDTRRSSLPKLFVRLFV